MRNKKMIRAVGLAGLWLAVAAPVMAVGEDSATVTVQGVQVAIDPATGRLVAPTDAQRQALSAAMSAPAISHRSSAVQLRPQTDADAVKTLRRSSTGRYSAVMQLPENLISSLAAEQGADGAITIHHQGDGSHAAASEVTQ